MYEELVKRLRITAQLAGKGLVITPSVCIEAADAIEELQRPKWNPVTERLPENDKTVLVWNRRNSREYFNVCDHGRWIILRQEDITHWMPLPEPPKEEKHDTDKRTT